MNKSIKQLVEEIQRFIGNDIMSDVPDSTEDVIRNYAFFKPSDDIELREHIKEKLKKGITNFNYIDVSELTKFNYIFEGLDPGEIDISEWDVSKGEYFIRMFNGCQNFNCDLSMWKLDNAINCFEMFADCESLTSAPQLTKKKLAEPIQFKKHISPYTYPTGCYEAMFYNCKSLKNIPKLPAIELTSYCYSIMFQGCTSLNKAPKLPARELAANCYSYMFAGCCSLEEPPVLPSVKLKPHCYSGMFYECTLLKYAPKLPATDLAPSCYAYMFTQCCSLTRAPELPALSSCESCYAYMFTGCINLTYIKMMATDSWYIGDSCTHDWVKNVANHGTFVINKECREGLDDEIFREDSKIPEHWKVIRG